MPPSATPNEPAASGDAPLQQFSQCHVGILSHLQDLSTLPALLGPAALARRIAGETAKFFRDVIFTHHAEEEQELFPAVLASAAAGDERARVQAIVERLTREHRDVEAAYVQLEPALKAAAKGHDATVDAAAVDALVRMYRGHAAYEEREFLPLSQTILGRNDKHLSALGLSLHLRHALPEVLSRFANRI